MASVNKGPGRYAFKKWQHRASSPKGIQERLDARIADMPKNAEELGLTKPGSRSGRKS